MAFQLKKNSWKLYKEQVTSQMSCIVSARRYKYRISYTWYVHGWCAIWINSAKEVSMLPFIQKKKKRISVVDRIRTCASSDNGFRIQPLNRSGTTTWIIRVLTSATLLNPLHGWPCISYHGVPFIRDRTYRATNAVPSLLPAYIRMIRMYIPNE